MYDNSSKGKRNLIGSSNCLRNISPSSLLNGKSPHEVLFNKQPTIGHLKIFGCPAYPLELNNKGDKFESVAQENCIMVGSDDKSGIYFIYNKYTKKVFRSRDVKFNEEPLLQEGQGVFRGQRRQLRRTDWMLPRQLR